MAEMDYRLIQKGDKPFLRLSQDTMEQVEVIEQLGDRYTIKLLDGTTKMRISSWSLVLFEINALVTAEIKRNGQIVHCLAKIQDIVETGNGQAVVTLQDALLDADNQPKQIDMLDLCGVQRINGQIVEHDMIPQGTKLEYRDDHDYYDVTIVKVNADRLNETIFDVEAKVNKYKKTLERDGRDPDIEQLLLGRERNLEGLKDRRQRFRLELAYVADSFAALKAIHLGIPKEVEWKEQQKTILKTRLSDIEDFIEKNKDRQTEIQETKQAALAKKRKSDGNAATHKTRKQIRLDRAPR